MLAGICIGTVVGVMLLPHDDSGRATVWLGLALVIYAVFGLVKGYFEVPPSMHSLSFERDKLVQALGLSFTVSTVTLAAALAYTGHLGTSLVGPSIGALGAALVGMWLGQLTRGKIKEETFRVWFFVGLLLLGGHLALRGVL